MASRHMRRTRTIFWSSFWVAFPIGLGFVM
jgi:hypothetical protein